MYWIHARIYALPRMHLMYCIQSSTSNIFHQSYCAKMHSSLHYNVRTFSPAPNKLRSVQIHSGIQQTQKCINAFQHPTHCSNTHPSVQQTQKRPIQPASNKLSIQHFYVLFEHPAQHPTNSCSNSYSSSEDEAPPVIVIETSSDEEGAPPVKFEER